MLITCEDCNTGFQLDDSRMKDEGVKVKCSKCGKVFMAHAPSSVEVSGGDFVGMQGLEEAPAEAEKNGLDFSEMEAMLSAGEDSDLDIFSDRNSNITDSGFGFAETNELDLSDMDQIFEGDEVSEAESLIDEEPEEIDFDLDEVLDTVSSLGSANGESEEIEELDLLDLDEEFEEEMSSIEEIEELNLEFDEVNDIEVPKIEAETDFSIEGESLGMESDIESGPSGMVEELGLSDIEMEDMLAVDEPTEGETLKDIEQDAELSFDLEKELEAGEISEEIGPVEIASEEDVDGFEELGLTDIEEMFTLEDGQELEEVEPANADELGLEMDETFELPEDSEEIKPDTADMAGVELVADDTVGSEDSEDDLDEFEEFGLAELEEMFNLEAEKKPEEPEPTVDDSNDIDFSDEDIDDGDSDELEFKLDEAIAVLDGSSEEEVGVEFEEYEELDLSELDDMFDKEEFVEKKEDPKKEELGDLDFAADVIPEAKEGIDALETEEDLGIADTSELDFSDIGEMLESEEELELPDTPGVKEDESGLDFEFESQTLVEDEPKASALTEAAEDTEDFGLSDDNLDLSDGDLDLSEMEKMFQETDSLEEDVASTKTTASASPPKIEEKEESIKAQDDLDFGLDEEDTQEDFFQTDEAQDIELEFGVEEEEKEVEIEESPVEKSDEDKEAAKGEEDDLEATYDMGVQLDKVRKQAAEKIKGAKVEEKTLTLQKTKMAKKGKPIPFEKKKKSTPVLVSLFLIILLVGAPIVLTNMGINIPYASDIINDLEIKIPFADKIQLANIPYIRDWIKPGDVKGTSKITILEPSINGYYVENTSEGDIFVISGNVRNDYDQLRSFISIKGQIYSKGKTYIETRTVFAGNVFSEEELSVSNSAVIDKRLKNKYGANRLNLKINKGKVIPFMIVFTKVPNDLEGYDIEVAGSNLFQVKGK